MFINVGYNLRPTNLNAVLGKNQLTKLDKNNQSRISNFEKFKTALLLDKRNQNSLLTVVASSRHVEPAWFGLCVFVKDGTDMNAYKDHLLRQRIETRPIVTGNFLRQPYFRGTYDHTLYEGAEIVHKNGLYIGLHTQPWSSEYVQWLVDALLAFFV
jgi:CDP-6-deoxy-D-xylo-4-hexulose-3-dehydrase